MASTDFQYLCDLPNFARLIKDGAYCPAEQSVYPSLTFPAHASIVTGCTPGNHGVINNYLFEPGAQRKRWNYHVRALKRKALWDYAAENGKKVLSLSWPVSAGANIRWSLPEMTPAKPKIWNFSSFASQLRVLFKNGTPSLAARALMLNPALTRAWFLGSQPTLDRGMIKLLKKSLCHYDFDIALFHVYGMDDAKHKYGADSLEARKYLPLYDELIGYLLDYADEAVEDGDIVTLMITGDHAQLDTQQAIYGNMLLADMGLCAWRDGKLLSWQALLDAGDGMAYLYVQEGNPKDEIMRKVDGRFRNHPGVERIIWPDELRVLGCDPSATLVLEAKKGYSFEAGWSAKPTDANAVCPNHYKALHGYLPTLPDYQTMFFCYGKAVKAGVIERMSIMDITPTICDWMGMRTEAMDGSVLRSVLKD